MGRSVQQGLTPALAWPDIFFIAAPVTGSLKCWYPGEMVLMKVMAEVDTKPPSWTRLAVSLCHSAVGQVSPRRGTDLGGL